MNYQKWTLCPLCAYSLHSQSTPSGKHFPRTDSFILCFVLFLSLCPDDTVFTSRYTAIVLYQVPLIKILVYYSIYILYVYPLFGESVETQGSMLDGTMLHNEHYYLQNSPRLRGDLLATETAWSNRISSLLCHEGQTHKQQVQFHN